MKHLINEIKQENEQKRSKRAKTNNKRRNELVRLHEKTENFSIMQKVYFKVQREEA